VSTFTLDTSGAVMLPEPSRAGYVTAPDTVWSDLSPFVQGYITAMLSSDISLPDGAVIPRVPVGFSDLAPTFLAEILRDCEDHLQNYASSDFTGRQFWAYRQTGQSARFKPIRLSLSDDGKVHGEEGR